MKRFDQIVDIGGLHQNQKDLRETRGKGGIQSTFEGWEQDPQKVISVDYLVQQNALSSWC